MADNKLRLPGGGGVTISGDAADKLISGADGRAALVYIYALRNSADFSVSSAAAALKMTGGELEAAIESLQVMGLVERQTEPEVQRPSPVAVDQNFKMLVGETQRKLGKTLSTSELTTLSSIYTDMSLPAEVISILVSHCIERERSRTNGKRLPTLREIENEGYRWSDMGITTLDAATEYLCKCTKAREKSSEVKTLLGISTQTLKNSEQMFIEKWLNMGFGLEEIAEAYDRTVLNTGSLHWNYMNKILSTWDEDGLHTMSDITEKDKPGKKTDRKNPSKSQSDPGEHEKDAVRRLQMQKKQREIEG